MSEHTPGPWRHWPCKDGSYDKNNDYIQIAAARTLVAKVNIKSVTEADVRLMVAAPELLSIATSVLGMLQNCNVTSGVCCCGEEMDRHSRAMDCGHTPVDSGGHYAEALFKDVDDAIAKAIGD